MPVILEHPDIASALRTGYPSWVSEETEVLNDEDDEEEDSEVWGDERQDDLFREMRERNHGGGAYE